MIAKKSLLLSCCMIVSFTISTAQHYFWADNKKNVLDPDSSVLVLMKGDLEIGRSVSGQADEKIERYDDCIILRNIKKTDVENLKSKKVDFVSAYRINSVPLIVTNVVSFKPKGTIGEIDRSFRKQIRFRDKPLQAFTITSLTIFEKPLLRPCRCSDKYYTHRLCWVFITNKPTHADDRLECTN